MKLFTTNNIYIVKECRRFFNFKQRARSKKFVSSLTIERLAA